MENNETENNRVSPASETKEPVSGEKQLIKQIQSDGKSVFRLKFLIRVISIIILSVILMLLIIYGATVIVNFSDSFPIKVMGQEGSISLCESVGMEIPSSHLEVPVSGGLDNISVVTIPYNVDELGGGSHNGDNYIAYTFYARNNQKGDLPISEKITILSTSKHADEAMRVRFYRNGEPTTYAKISAVGTPEYGTVPFLDDDTVMTGETVLREGEVLKYTIVIWIEGNDPECVNEICGGSVRLGIEFSASES